MVLSVTLGVKTQMKTVDVVIIGAGSVGTPLAYHLADKGLKVGVLDRLSSVGRGENKAAIGGVRATHSDPAKISIGKLSLEFFRRMKPEFGQDVDYLEGGYLFPAYNQEIEEKLKSVLIKQKQFGLHIDWISPDRIAELVPGISREGLLGGTFSPQDGNLSPLKLAGAFYRMARQKGAEFHFDTEVTGFTSHQGKVTIVHTSKGDFQAKYVVNAAGGYAREIGQMLGTELAVFPDSHEAGVTEPVARFFSPMVVDIRSTEEADNYYFYQNEEGAVIFCLTPRPKRVGTDTRCTSTFLPLVVSRMLRIYPRLKHLKIRRTWCGLYPMTPDQSPLVGFDSTLENVYHVVGMCGQGLMLGPGLAMVVSDVLASQRTVDQKLRDILTSLSPTREFTSSELLK